MGPMNASLTRASAPALQPHDDDPPPNALPRDSDWRTELTEHAERSSVPVPPALSGLDLNRLNPGNDLHRSLLITGLMQWEAVGPLRAILTHWRVPSLTIIGPVGDAGWRTLRNAVTTAIDVQTLELHRLTLGRTQSAWFRETTGQMRGLTTLVLNEVGWKKGSRKPGKALVPSGVRSLHVETATSSNSYPLVSLVLKSSELFELKIEGHGMDLSQHKALASKLKTQHKLSSLALNAITTTARSRKAFGYYRSILARHPTLAHLDLTGNNLGEQSCNLLISALKNNKALERLCLKDCFLKAGGFGARALKLELLMQLSGLTELDLSENKSLGDAALVPMLKALSGNNKLRLLDLRSTGAGKPSFQALALSLKTNRTLTHLRLPAIEDPDCLQELANAMQQNTTLHHFDIQGAMMTTGRVPEALLDAVRRNRWNHQQRQITFLRGGMQGLWESGESSIFQRLPPEIAAYTAELAYARDPSTALNLALVNHHTLEGAQQALEKLASVGRAGTGAAPEN